MRNIKWLVAAGLLVSATGCIESSGYPTTSYGGYPSSNGYYAQPTYYRQQPTYYQQQPAYYQQQPTYYQQPQTRYVPVPVQTQRYVPASNSRSSWSRRDDDGDGIPNRYDKDKNNDGVPDRQQRRGWQG